ncbi:MAG TPA: hypothetical protein VKU60_13700 [Chloroflexota bacterium]|nr:hypothetical protein [Chloroflexota bacterium]
MEDDVLHGISHEHHHDVDDAEQQSDKAPLTGAQLAEENGKDAQQQAGRGNAQHGIQHADEGNGARQLHDERQELSTGNPA